MATKKRKGIWGRPQLLDNEVVQKLVEIFRIDGTVEEACSQAEISRATFYNYYSWDYEYLDNDGKKKSFKTTIDKAREYPFILAKSTLILHAKKDPKCAIEFLRRRHVDYKDKTETTLKGDAENPVQIFIPDNGRWPKN